MIDRPLYLQRILSFQNSGLIKVITGMRRSGKSTLLLLYRDWLRNQGLADEEIIYINFESLSNEEWTDYKKLYEAITSISKERKRKVFLLLDEIQNVHSWEKVINSLRIDIDCDITITGSNAKLLSGELATYLAGRYIEIQVYPLSFEEYLNFRNARSEQGKIPEYFEEFLKLGGMPGLHEIHGSPTAKCQYLSDIFDSVLLKDVITRNNIRDTELLRRIIIFLMDNIGSSFSAQTVSNFLKNQGRRLSTETVYNYLDFLENALIIERARRFDLKGKNYLTTQEKIFVTDVGIRNAVLGYKPKDIAGVLENVVFLNLRQKGYSVSVGTLGKQEIDFVGEKDGRKQYIQVTYQLTPDNYEREIAPLKKIKDDYPKILLTMSPDLTGDEEGIQIQYLPDFLLSGTITREPAYS